MKMPFPILAAGLMSVWKIAEDMGLPRLIVVNRLDRERASLDRAVESLREAFGRGVPELAAATRVWRDFFADPEEVYTEGFRLIRECWDAA